MFSWGDDDNNNNGGGGDNKAPYVPPTSSTTNSNDKKRDADKKDDADDAEKGPQPYVTTPYVPGTKAADPPAPEKPSSCPNLAANSAATGTPGAPAYIKPDQPDEESEASEGQGLLSRFRRRGNNSSNNNNNNASRSAASASRSNAPRIQFEISDYTISMERRTFIFGIVGLVAFLVGLGVLLASLRKVEETQYGLQYNIYRKKLDDAAKSGGLFLGPPGYEFIKFPSTYITVDMNDRMCVSRDGLRVGFSVTFQYRMSEANMLPAIIKYREFEKWAKIVEAAGLSAIHHSCGDFNISDFQQKRGQIQSRMEENLKLKLEGDPENDEEGVYALAISLQLRELGLPEAYQSAVADKQRAEEDIALAINQRKQEMTKAETELLKAQQQAIKIMDTATIGRDIVLAEAILKAQETLYSFEQEGETILYVKDSLNLTTEGVLAYMANSLLSKARNLHISTGEPAKLSRSDEL